MSDEPVYRAIIGRRPRRPTGQWYWRVEVDVCNGQAWSGYADSYSEAVARASEKLRLANERGNPESSAARFVRAMEELRDHVVMELERARKGV